MHFLAKSQTAFRVFIVCGTLFVFVYASSIGLRNLFRYNTFKREVQAKQMQLDELEFLHQEYSYALEAIQTDDYWIVEAKKNLGYSQVGEIVYKFY